MAIKVFLPFSGYFFRKISGFYDVSGKTLQRGLEAAKGREPDLSKSGNPENIFMVCSQFLRLTY